jgi:hypothetical protein
LPEISLSAKGLQTEKDDVPDKYSRTGSQIQQQKMASDCLACGSFQAAERTLEGVEALHMVRKGQVKKLDGSDAVGQAMFVETLFNLAAWRNSLAELSRLTIFFATQPAS